MNFKVLLTFVLLNVFGTFAFANSASVKVEDGQIKTVYSNEVSEEIYNALDVEAKPARMCVNCRWFSKTSGDMKCDLNIWLTVDGYEDKKVYSCTNTTNISQ